LKGSIPSSIGHLTNLQRLYIAANSLTGTIPEELGTITTLEELVLSIKGTIPSFLGNLTNLQLLYLSQNHPSQLKGSIPSSLGNLTKLQKIGLSGLSSLRGCFPLSWQNRSWDWCDIRGVRHNCNCTIKNCQYKDCDEEDEKIDGDTEGIPTDNTNRIDGDPSLESTPTESTESSATSQKPTHTDPSSNFTGSNIFPQLNFYKFKIRSIIIAFGLLLCSIIILLWRKSIQNQYEIEILIKKSQDLEEKLKEHERTIQSLRKFVHAQYEIENFV